MNIQQGHKLLVSILAVPLVASAGCATLIDSAIDRTAQRTGEGVGDAVGAKTGAAAGAAVAPMVPGVDMSGFYVQFLFSVAFHAGTYSIGEKPYQPGEWTRWQMTGSNNDKPATMERAFLRKEADGKEWWRVKWNDSGSGDTVTLEGLFSADASQLVRLRGKMPKETEAKEMPVQQGTAGYVKPMPLSPESVKGATVGRESITVPAGRFDATHVRYGDAGGGSLDWWLYDAVPGGMVKYTHTGAQQGGGGRDGNGYVVQLLASGNGARSELGSF